MAVRKRGGAETVTAPFNPNIAEALYLTRYAENAGSGTTDMIRLCREAGLRPPVYQYDHGGVQDSYLPEYPTQVVRKVVRSYQILEERIPLDLIRVQNNKTKP